MAIITIWNSHGHHQAYFWTVSHNSLEIARFIASEKILQKYDKDNTKCNNFKLDGNR